jgi:hypothetical protein
MTSSERTSLQPNWPVALSQTSRLVELKLPKSTKVRVAVCSADCFQSGADDKQAGIRKSYGPAYCL